MTLQFQLAVLDLRLALNGQRCRPSHRTCRLSLKRAVTSALLSCGSMLFWKVTQCKSLFHSRRLDPFQQLLMNLPLQCSSAVQAAT